MDELESLKEHLEVFFKSAQMQNIYKKINKDEVSLNKMLFELEKHLLDLKEKYKVNQNLNTNIISSNILNSFNSRSTFFRSKDYALSFLVFLSMEGSHDAENLLKMIDKYIDIIKEKLSYQDIVKTGTGATRCYTNLRFNLNDLRNFGLVYSETIIKGRFGRSLLPTPVGYFISLSVNDPAKFDINKHLPERGNASNQFVTPLYSALRKIKNDPEQFINDLLARYESVKPLTDILKKMLDEYCNYILKYIELTKDGLRIDEIELEKSIKNYYQIIASQVDVSLELKTIVLSIAHKTQ